MNYKVNFNIILRNIAGSFILIPTGSKALKHHEMLEISESGALIWNHLLEKASTIDELTDNEYEITRQQAMKDVSLFIQDLIEEGVLCYE